MYYVSIPWNIRNDSSLYFPLLNESSLFPTIYIMLSVLCNICYLKVLLMTWLEYFLG